MAYTSACRPRHPLQLSTLLLAMLLGVDAAWAKPAKKSYLDMTVAKRTLKEHDRISKAVNISCFVDPKVTTLVFISVDRVLVGGNIPRQQLLEAHTDISNGSARTGRDSAKKSSKVYQLQGSVQQRWVNLVLSEFTSADDGEYYCFAVYKHPLSQQLQSHEASYLLFAEELWGSAVVHAHADDAPFDLGSWWLNAFKAGALTFLTIMAVFVIGAVVANKMCRRKRDRRPSAASTPARGAAPVGMSGQPTEPVLAPVAVEERSTEL